MESRSERRLVPVSWGRAGDDAKISGVAVCISSGGEGVESLIRIASGLLFASGAVRVDIISKTSGRDERRIDEADILTRG